MTTNTRQLNSQATTSQPTNSQRTTTRRIGTVLGVLLALDTLLPLAGCGWVRVRQRVSRLGRSAS